MNEFSFSDRELTYAAAQTADSMLDTLPQDGPNHTFSPRFEQKMALLLNRERHRRQLRAVMGRAAAVFLAVLIGLGAWLAVDREARAAVVRWAREVYENSIVYRFSGEIPGGALPTLRPTWLPEGYEEVAVMGDETVQVLLYQKGDDAITLTYYWMHEGGAGFLSGTGGVEVEVSVNGCAGYFYPAADDNSSHDLIWINDKLEIMFILQSHLPQDDIMHIAESIELAKTPK